MEKKYEIILREVEAHDPIYGESHLMLTCSMKEVLEMGEEEVRKQMVKAGAQLWAVANEREREERLARFREREKREKEEELRELKQEG